MRKVVPVLVAALVVLGVAAAASAEQGQLSLGYWVNDTKVTFPGNLPAQEVSSPAIVGSGSFVLMPKVAINGEFALAREVEGKQGSDKFKVQGSQTLVYGSYQLLEQSGLSVAPAVGFVAASNNYDWSPSTTKYAVSYSGVLVGGVIKIDLASGLQGKVILLYGPKVGITDGFDNSTYTSTLTSVAASLSINVYRNVALEVGYRGLSQAAKKDNTEKWDRSTTGFFAGASISF
ncbi:MAG TPA: hypothetical protein GXX55_05245 [Firmicutes bacterium]|nr:hypothetical protein [Bacillota bacterium]